MWVRVGSVPAGERSMESLRRLSDLIVAAGYPRAPLRADRDTGVIYLDVGVAGAPPEQLVRNAVVQASQSP